MNPGELAPLKLLIRGFGVRVPGGAPVKSLLTPAISTAGLHGPRARAATPLIRHPLPGLPPSLWKATVARNERRFRPAVKSCERPPARVAGSAAVPDRRFQLPQRP